MNDDLSKIIAAFPVATVIVGDDERIIHANQSASDVFGHHLVGRNYMTGFRQPQVLDAIETSLKTSEATTASFQINDSGRERKFQASIRPLILSDFSGVLASIEDVTRIHEAGEIRRDFVANVSHELRTPLTAILGFIETLRGPAQGDPDAQVKFLGIMETEAKRMVRLVQDLLALSRVEREERLRPDEETDLVSVLNATLERLQPIAAEAGVDLVAGYPVSTLEMRGNSDQLEQVFTNLIENAIKYGGGGGRVEIALDHHTHDAGMRGPAVQISIQDYGAGIDSTHIPRLTERFYRVDTHRSREKGGTGLGLAIVKHILNRHRGRLRVTSIKGQGTCFSVILPL